MSQDQFNPAEARGRRGFTLIEVLVVIGIVMVISSLLLVAVNAARKKARAARTASDMQTIAVALEAYKQDFGDYPRLDYTATAPVQGPPSIANLLAGPPAGYVANAKFISGGELLAWALVGPYAGTANAAPTGPNDWNRQDGKDGMGFRVGTSTRGTVYGPYLDVETFLHNPATSNDDNPTFRYYFYLHDVFRQPILYFPRLTAAATNNPTALYNVNDDAIAFVRQPADTPALVTSRFNAILIKNNATGPYLLWSAGPDQQFSVEDPSNNGQVQSCDDVLFSGGQ